MYLRIIMKERLQARRGVFRMKWRKIKRSAPSEARVCFSVYEFYIAVVQRVWGTQYLYEVFTSILLI